MASMPHKPISVIDLIKRDHIEMLRCTRILYDPNQALNVRQMALENFVTIWIDHSTAEERVFYPVVAKALPDAKSATYAQEHQYLKPHVEQLRAISPNDVRFLGIFQNIDTTLVRHNDEEEVFILRELQSVLTEEGLYRMGEMFYYARQHAGGDGGELATNKWKAPLDEFLENIANYKKPPPAPHVQQHPVHPSQSQPVHSVPLVQLPHGPHSHPLPLSPYGHPTPAQAIPQGQPIVQQIYAHHPQPIQHHPQAPQFAQHPHGHGGLHYLPPQAPPHLQQVPPQLQLPMPSIHSHPMQPHPQQVLDQHGMTEGYHYFVPHPGPQSPGPDASVHLPQSAASQQVIVQQPQVAMVPPQAFMSEDEEDYLGGASPYSLSPFPNH